MRTLVIFILIILSSCTPSNQDKAENAVKEHLRKTLHDWNSYESVEFSALDSSFTSIYDNVEYMSAINRYKSLEKELADEETYSWTIKGDSPSARKLIDMSLAKSKAILDSMSIYPKIMIEIENTFQPEFKGWRLQHSFRANNAGGNKIIVHNHYYLDKDFTEILKVEDISK